MISTKNKKSKSMSGAGYSKGAGQLPPKGPGPAGMRHAPAGRYAAGRDGMMPPKPSGSPRGGRK